MNCSMKYQNSLLPHVRAIIKPVTYKAEPKLPLHVFSRSTCNYVCDNIYSRNRIISDLMKSGSLDYAFKLFGEMPVRDVISWNIMISGCTRNGFPMESLHLYNQMVCEGFVENSSTFSSVLSICSNAGFYGVGRVVHCRAFVLGFGMNLYISSALVDLYMCMGLCDIALRLFRSLPERNLATWNVVLRRASESGSSEELFRLYSGMKFDGVEPNGLTFCYLIKGCGHERFLDEGMQLHCFVIKKGLIHSNVFIANAMVDFYSACGSLTEAKRLFELIPLENVISWNSMVSVSAANGDAYHALEIFKLMQFWDMKPSAISFLGFLKLSSGSKDMLLGKQIHTCILKLGLDTVFIQSALIDMYGKCGDLDRSFRIFESVPEKSLECCNSLMSSFLRSGLKEDVIELFGVMVDNQIGYDEVSLSLTLKALSTSTFAGSSSCMLLHCCVIKSGFEADIAVACSLMDAYSKSGEIKISQNIFDQIYAPNVICFTSLIGAFACNGFGMKCLEILDKMVQNGVKPDKVTFLNVLMGCNHSGLVEEGKLVFQSMQTYYAVNPERQHYSCMIDLLGRAGLLEQAECLLKSTPWEDDTIIWSSVLRSCIQNEHKGKRAVKKLVELDRKNPAGLLQASNFYSDIGDFESSEQLQDDAVATKMSRERGQSLIEVCNCG